LAFDYPGLLVDISSLYGDASGIMLFPMTASLAPLRFVLIVLSGWMNSRQTLLKDYLCERNRVLRERLGDKELLAT
jgi:hypothetical protein